MAVGLIVMRSLNEWRQNKNTSKCFNNNRKTDREREREREWAHR